MTRSDGSASHNLNSQRVLITGAARGLGAAFAHAAAQAGAHVVLADVDMDAAQAVAAQIGSAAHAVHMDVASSDSVQQGMAQALNWLGGLDAVVNNAAVTNSGGKRLEELDESVFDRVMQVNVKGPWLVTRAALPSLKASAAAGRAARVVNIASDTALWGAPRLMAYVASKGAVISMTRSMARELGEFGIAVNAIAPGLVVGESTQYVPEERHTLYREGRAIKRPQWPEDCIAALSFLLSAGAGFITGQVLPVNGGFVMN